MATCEGRKQTRYARGGEEGASTAGVFQVGHEAAGDARPETETGKHAPLSWSAVAQRRRAF